MPIEFNKDNQNDSDDLGSSQPSNENLSTPIGEAMISSENNNDTITYGLTANEMNDPNSISVTVSDPNAPLIVLFGPPSSGKTMTLVRLTRYLKSKGYTIAPIKTFRPAYDANYAEICANFDAMINSDNAAQSTSRISFMLVEVIKNGKRICQILEAPGEYYFDPKKANAEFPSYVNTIISSNNRKIWAVMVEPDWLNQTDRSNYVTKITKLKQQMRTKDNVVFVFNKIDKTNFVRSIGDVNIQAAITEVQNIYPAIFTPFLNQNPITKFWKKHNCKFVPFQTGFYTEAVDRLTYQEGPEEYCKKLWDTLMKNIYG